MGASRGVPGPPGRHFGVTKTTHFDHVCSWRLRGLILALREAFLGLSWGPLGAHFWPPGASWGLVLALLGLCWVSCDLLGFMSDLLAPPGAPPGFNCIAFGVEVSGATRNATQRHTQPNTQRKATQHEEPRNGTQRNMQRNTQLYTENRGSAHNSRKHCSKSLIKTSVETAVGQIRKTWKAQWAVWGRRPTGDPATEPSGSLEALSLIHI